LQAREKIHQNVPYCTCYCIGGFLKEIFSGSQAASCTVGCALTFDSEAKFEIEAKILFRLEAKKALFHMIHFDAKHEKSEEKTKVKQAKIKQKNRNETKIKRKNR
jgi:hypothetical protein